MSRVGSMITQGPKKEAALTRGKPSREHTSDHLLKGSDQMKERRNETGVNQEMTTYHLFLKDFMVRESRANLRKAVSLDQNLHGLMH